MDTAKFFEKFELFAHPEEAAKHFREVVLNLAFSGKLKGTDLSGWETHPIGDFFTEGLKSINAPDTPNQTYELWSVPSFETGAPEIVTGAQVGSTKRELRDGTILLGKMNPHLNRIWVVNRRTNHPMIASQEWINITAGDTWDTGYLARLLSSPSFNRSICATAQGMGSLTRANTKQVAQIPVHRPPLMEQKKLIAQVDELMALCDRLEAQLKERDVKQAALAKAALAKFTEDPTPENLHLLFHPSFSIEPDDLRNTILGSALEGTLTNWATKETDWNIVSLKDVCSLITDGEHLTPQRTSSGVPLATAKNVRDGFLDMTQTDFVSVPTAQKCWNRCKPKDGDILMVCVGATTGRVCLVSNPPEMVLVRSVALLRPNKQLIDPRYLDLFLRSPSGQTQIWSGVKQNAQPCLYLGKMAIFKIRLPGLETQKLIVAEAAKLIGLVKALESQIKASRMIGEKLLEAMVAELTAA